MNWVKSWYFKQIAWIVIVGLFVISAVPAKSMAYVVAGDVEAGATITRADDIDKVQRVLESKVVAKKLQDMGLTPEEVVQRLDRLTDDELHGFATQLDHLYPGGDALGVIIALLIIVILVLLIFKLTDKKIVIK